MWKCIMLLFFNRVSNKSQNLYIHHIKLVKQNNLAEIEQIEVI